MKRHHGALAKAHQRQARFIEPMFFQFAIDEAIERSGRVARALLHQMGIEIGNREPLIAAGDLRHAFDAVGRHEGRARQRLGPIGRKA